MNPLEYELLIAEYFKKLGYSTINTTYSNDYGVDVFAQKENEKIAIQAKMYGSGSRKINRQMVMELHGAKDYFECTKAIIATDGIIMNDALEVANKLKIEILYIEQSKISLDYKVEKIKNELSFESIWEDFIVPLKGKTLIRENGETNKILDVNWSEIKRLTKNGKNSNIKIEIFKDSIEKILKEGYITRDYINQNYIGRASSGIILILSQIPLFELVKSPLGIKYKK